MAKGKKPGGEKVRVLPLGGLGEIGKNMTVIEYRGKIVVVDTLMFDRRCWASTGATGLLLPARTCR
jgi:mRNA degradation ribonuclease J1/J2